MPFYFFDIDERIVDEQGVELPDTASARAYAAGIASTFPPPEAGRRRRSVVVRTEAGEIIDPSDNSWSSKGSSDAPTTAQ